MRQLITNYYFDTCFNTTMDTTSYRPCEILYLSEPCYHNFMDITCERTRPSVKAILAPSFLSKIAEMSYGRGALTGMTDRSVHRFCLGSTMRDGCTVQSRRIT